jgi:hypothetical protein
MNPPSALANMSAGKSVGDTATSSRSESAANVESLVGLEIESTSSAVPTR